jgi:hypothetical protein
MSSSNTLRKRNASGTGPVFFLSENMGSTRLQKPNNTNVRVLENLVFKRVGYLKWGSNRRQEKLYNLQYLGLLNQGVRYFYREYNIH